MLCSEVKVNVEARKGKMRGSSIWSVWWIGKSLLQDAQKVQTSYPPNPGGYFTRPPLVCQDSLFAQGRALAQARPQREAYPIPYTFLKGSGRGWDFLTPDGARFFVRPIPNLPQEPPENELTDRWTNPSVRLAEHVRGRGL